VERTEEAQKQIKDIALTLCTSCSDESALCKHSECKTCATKYLAEAVYDEGYRRAKDVVRRIIDELTTPLNQHIRGEITDWELHSTIAKILLEHESEYTTV
jgi:hypothetical protein